MDCCRFCAKCFIENELLSISLDTPSVRNKIEVICSFFNANYIDLGDQNLPKTICAPCYQFIKETHQYFNKVKTVQNDLKNKIHSCLPFDQTDLTNNVLEEEFYTETDLTNIGHLSTCKTEGLNQTNDSIFEKPSSSCTLHKELIENEHKHLIRSNTDTIDQSLLNCNNFKIETSENDDEPLSTFIKEEYSNDVMRVGVSLYDNYSNDFQDMKLEKKRSWLDFTWLCSKCQGEAVCFATLHELREHSKKKHKLCNIFFCADCNIAFNLYDDWTSHMISHFDELSQFCPICNIQLDSDLKQHLEFHKEIAKMCLTCGEQFKTTASLKAHKTKYKVKQKVLAEVLSTKVPNGDDDSWTGYKWTCLVCHKVFPNIAALRVHSKAIHKKCFTVRCVDCDDVFDSYVALVRHVRRHRPYLKYYCHYCNHKYQKPASESAHLLQHFDDKILRNCDCCGEIFETRDQLQTHKKLYKPPTPKRLCFKKRERPVTIEELTCKTCFVITKNLNVLRQHNQTHKERRRDHTCESCGKAFYTKHALAHHKLMVHTTKDYICEICNRGCATRNLLQTHMKIHSGEKPFQCNECGRLFRLKKQLRDHWIIHTDQMPYQCSFCDKKFRFSSVMQVHRRQHTGERPYLCPACPKDFVSGANRLKHIRRIHGKGKDLNEGGSKDA